jgi:hypothetical protein
MVKGNYDGSLFITHAELVTTEPSKIKSIRKNSDDLSRAQKLYSAMQSFFNDVDVVCVEIPHGSQSARSMASYGICIGILASLGKPLIQITAVENKQAALGKKSGSKAQMIEWATNKHPEVNWLKRKVKGELTLTNANEHLADALSSIYAGMRTNEFKLLNI